MVSAILPPINHPGEKDPVALLLASLRDHKCLCLARHYLSEEGTIHRLSDDTPADIIHLFYSESLDMRYTTFVDFHKEAYLTLNRLLLEALDADPSRLESPETRTAVAVAALSVPQSEEALQSWVRRMADGPICLYARHIPILKMIPSFRNLSPPSELEEDFFPRWDERLGSRLTPTMDINTHFPNNLSEESACQLLERIRFTGSPAPGELSPMAEFALHRITEEALLLRLLQPGELLAQEDPAPLLRACQALPPAQRNFILPHICRKTVNYGL